MHSVQLPMSFFVSYLSIMEWLDIFTILVTGVTASPTSSTVVALNDVTLTCIPTTTPDGYSWHRVDGDVPSHSSGQNTNRLTIHRAVPADEGQYYCMAMLFGHCAVSNNVMVTVEGKKMTSYICNLMYVAIIALNWKGYFKCYLIVSSID